MEWSDLSSAQQTKLWAENDELELAALNNGADRYKEQCARQPMSQWSSARRLIVAALDQVVEGVEHSRMGAEQGNGMRGCQGWGVQFLIMDPGVLALASICASLDAVRTGKDANGVPLPWLIMKIGNRIQQEYHFMMLKEEFPKLEAYMRRRLRKGWSPKSLRVARKRMGELGDNWSQKVVRQVGGKMLEILVETSGMLEVHSTFKKGKHIKRVRITPIAQKAMLQADTEAEVLNPLLTPMVVPPNKWEPGVRGGYRLLARYHSMTKQTMGGPPPVDDHAPMVYHALNAVQETSWKINDRVLWAMHQAWEQGGNCAGLPPVDALPHWREHEPKPVDGTKEEIREWNIKAERVHTENARLVGKRLSFLSTIMIADEYIDRTFYFPHNCDFRGRMYPLPTFLHPQSNDVARGLLTFGKAKPLGKTGAWWLTIHVANCFGVDKVSYDERVAWVSERMPWFHQMAVDPMLNRGWMDADKPWQALAALTELSAALTHEGGPALYESSLPVSVDGSNSGLQHFSAMLRDEHGAKLVNLGPSPSPSDIYTDVADWVQCALDEAVESGVMPESELAGWAGRINRKLCKRGTMTYCYGVTLQGLDDALIADGLCDWADDRFSASRSIGKLIWKGIQANITGAAEAMAWLKKVASKANKYSVPLEWHTPSGFHVVHPYNDYKMERIVCMSAEVGFYLYDPDGGIRKYKQANSIAPNFVHSLDASHLTMVVSSGIVLGITHWMMIHDSFGTHACDVELLQATLKEEFVKLYSLNVLESFRQQTEQQCNTMMPDPPEMGSFDLDSVYESDYIFS